MHITVWVVVEVVVERADEMEGQSWDNGRRRVVGYLRKSNLQSGLVDLGEGRKWSIRNRAKKIGT